MIGYSLEHPNETYEMYNSETDSIIITYSIKWTDFNRWELKSSEIQICKLYDAESSQNDPKYVYFDSSYEIFSKQRVDSLKGSSSANLLLATTPSIIRTRNHGPPSPPAVDTSNSADTRKIKRLSTSTKYKVTRDTTPHQKSNKNYHLFLRQKLIMKEVFFLYINTVHVLQDKK